MHCAGHDDALLVETLWSHILEAEMTRRPGAEAVPIVAGKVKALAKLYANSSKYFPMGEFY